MATKLTNWTGAAAGTTAAGHPPPTTSIAVFDAAPGRAGPRAGSMQRSRCATLPVVDATWLDVALEQARAGWASGGVPVGAALVGADGTVLGRGHNRRVQDDDPSAHAETAAFRDAGRLRDYRATTMVTTLSPCWFCCGLVRQFGIGAVLIGESVTFTGGHDWLAGLGVRITVLDDPRCVELMTSFIATHPRLWNEDIGVAE